MMQMVLPVEPMFQKDKELACPSCDNVFEDWVHILDGIGRIDPAEWQTCGGATTLHYSEYRCPQCNATLWVRRGWC
jgi:DNA-directed RNA polymerase subunit RPC12/RpoP